MKNLMTSTAPLFVISRDKLFLVTVMILAQKKCTDTQYDVFKMTRQTFPAIVGMILIFANNMDLIAKPRILRTTAYFVTRAVWVLKN